MHCDVYKFPKHEEVCLYCRPDYPDDTEELKDWLAVLPKDLRQNLGEGRFLMHLDPMRPKNWLEWIKMM